MILSVAQTQTADAVGRWERARAPVRALGGPLEVRLDEPRLGDTTAPMVDERQRPRRCLALFVKPRRELAEGLVDDEGEEPVREHEER